MSGGENRGKEQGLPAGGTSKLRRGSCQAGGPLAPKLHEADIAQGLITLSHLSPEELWQLLLQQSRANILWLSARSQASPPAHRVQDRREVLLGKSLEVLGTALSSWHVPPPPSFRWKLRSDCGRWTPASSPSSTTSHQPTRHELNRKTHVFPALAEAHSREARSQS